MSVVAGSEWEELKRYNLNELYRMMGEGSGGGDKAAEGDAAKAEVTKTETTEGEVKATAVETG